jgi:outer membrane protein assembly factor BamB
MTTKTASVISLAFFAALAVPVHAGDWPQWRGPSRDGISRETGLLSSWPKDGPKVAWKSTGLGEGYSGFSVSQGRIFTQGQRPGQEYVIALDTSTGKEIWETVTTSHVYEEGHGDGPRGTPTIDGDRLYAEAADGTLVCLEAATGKKIWSVNFVENFGGHIPHWGYSESPLVDGNNLIVTPGGSQATVAALDKATGKAVWKSAQGDGAAYSSPIEAQTGDVRQFIVFTARGVMGVRASNGDFLWRYNKVANTTANIATPIYQAPFVFASSDYGTGCALLKLTAEGGGKDGRVKATEVYFNKDMRNHYSTSVLVRDTVYGYSSSILTAMNLATGEVAWRDRSVGKGSVTLADGKLYLLGEDGVVGLAEATPEGYKEISRFSIDKGSWPTWSPLVIANGRMYLREQDNLYCFDIKAN